MYKINENDTILRKSDGSWIPKDYGNSDYQQFIADVKEMVVEEKVIGSSFLDSFRELGYFNQIRVP